MLRLVVTLSIILVFVFGFNTRAQEVKKTKVLIFAGQSNMDGKGDGLLLSETQRKVSHNKELWPRAFFGN
jgi:hypothetical protein